MPSESEPRHPPDIAEPARLEHDTLFWRLTEHVPAVIFQYRRTAGGWESMPYATEGLRHLYGLSPDEVSHDAAPMHASIHPEDRSRVRDSIAESARTLAPWRLEFRAQVPEGLRWHEGHAMPEREADGGTLWYGYIVDITERKRYQEALVSVEAAQRANAAKTEFLSRMSHELRTPLNAVLGFAQLMQIDETQPVSDVQRARIAHIERAGAHLLAMINDVLDLSRIESGTMPLTPEPLAAAAVIEDALALVASQAHGAGIKLAPFVGSRDAWVRADRVRLRQVLVNLLSNAVKYNRRGGLVHVRSERFGDEVAIGVTDTGIGLTPDQLAHLWEPFNRLGAERTSVEGTGIGLALSQRMVQMMDGRIEVQSQPGRGSSFTVHLPAADAPQPAERTAAPRLSAAHGAMRRRTVLYAEDNPINVELVQQVFHMRPQLRLLVAESGAQALQLARASAPDLLLLDIHLGDMSGLEVRSLLAGEGIHPPAVALSADVQPERVKEAMAAGFVDYLEKPLDVAALVRCVERVLGM
jgi:PAS domain S-box-containing protein